MTTTTLADAQMRDILKRPLKAIGRRVDLSSPFVDAKLLDGARLHVVGSSLLHSPARTAGSLCALDRN